MGDEPVDDVAVGVEELDDDGVHALVVGAELDVDRLAGDVAGDDAQDDRPVVGDGDGVEGHADAVGEAAAQALAVEGADELRAGADRSVQRDPQLGVVGRIVDARRRIANVPPGTTHGVCSTTSEAVGGPSGSASPLAPAAGAAAPERGQRRRRAAAERLRRARRLTTGSCRSTARPACWRRKPSRS